MKVLIATFITVLISTQCLAYGIDDLNEFSKQVPVQAIDKEVLGYIKKEISSEITNFTSHYTLALYEEQAKEKSWFILDGYYILPSGEILFLDFYYNPISKKWWPIENYRSFTTGLLDRFMLQAEEVCNPFKRHYIGVVRTGGSFSIDKLQSYLKSRFPYSPSLWFYRNNLYILDHVSIGLPDSDPLFTLAEDDLVKDLLELNLVETASLLPSGRRRSNDVVKQTYIPVGDSCN